MQINTEQLRVYFSQVQLGEGSDTVDRVLEFLWDNYNDMFPREDDRVREAEQKLTHFYEALSRTEADRLFMAVGDLCTVYERAAFLNGLRVGAKLTTELYGDVPSP